MEHSRYPLLCYNMLYILDSAPTNKKKKTGSHKLKMYMTIWIV